MGWRIRLNNGRIDALYNGQVVLGGLELRGLKQTGQMKFLLERYGEPYPVSLSAGQQTIHILKLVSPDNGPTDVLMEVFCGTFRIALRLYPREPFTFKLSGLVHWGQEPYLCRIEPGRFGDVVQAALGPVDNILCDCLFDKWGDSVARFSSWGNLSLKAQSDGRAFVLQTDLLARFGTTPDLLAIEVIPHYISEHCSMPHYKPYDRTHHPLPPSGWCSWYYYGREITEEHMVSNVDWLAEHLKPFGLEYVQLDDGYQRESWLDWNEKFPRGGQWLAKYIRSKGLKPGIWILPQAVGEKDTPLVEERPDWFLHRPDGEIFRAFGDYPYLDPTNPEVISDWFEKTFTTMAHQWGIDYYKIDGEGEMQQWYALCRKNLCDSSLTPDQVYRSWVELIRRIIGPERILLICATQWRAMGYGDACRTGTDISPTDLKGTENFENALRATFSSYWMHTIAWYCDPDVLIVRRDLPLEVARSWASLLGLSGQVLMLSDPMTELPEERVELLRQVLPAQAIRPMDIWPRRPEWPYPQVWNLKVATSWGRWNVVGLFRWFQKDKSNIHINPEMLGLQPGCYVIYDVWEKSFGGELGAGRSFELAPESCRVLCLRPVERVPLLLGTSRHITQGYPDLLDLNWDPTDRVMTGQSMVVGGNPYEIRILIELNEEKYVPRKVEADCTEATYCVDGQILVVTIKDDTSKNVSWRVWF